MQFRVWGLIGGAKFDQVFASVAEWRAERKIIERTSSVRVLGMAPPGVDGKEPHLHGRQGWRSICVGSVYGW